MRFIFILLIPFLSFSQVGTDTVIQSDSIYLDRDTFEREYFKISGIVSEYNTNTRLPFVNFFTKSNLGTISNNDGEIVFKYPKNLAGDSVYLSSIGYKNQDFILPNRDTTNLNWVLELDTISLKEVIVNPKEAIEIISTAIDNIKYNYDTESFVVENFFSLNSEVQISLNTKQGTEISNRFLQEQQASFIQRNKPNISKKEKDEILLNAFKGEGFSPPNDDFVDYALSLFLAQCESEGDSIEWPEDKGNKVYWRNPNINWRDSIKNILVNLSKSIPAHSYYATLKQDFVRNIESHFLFSKKNLKKYNFDLRSSLSS